MAQKTIKERIESYFFRNPTSRLRVRQIEKLLNLPLPSVIRYCKELEAQGILTRIIMGSVTFYAADRSNPKFLLEKRLFNIRELYTCGLVDFLKREMHNPAIIVFGSYAKGEDIETSDIDLYIEAVTKHEITISGYEKVLDRSIQLFIHKNIKHIRNGHLANNILNGVIISGYIEVF